VSRATLWTLLLASLGGFVDAVGFLALFQMFTAHMSGNSVWLGASFGSGDWRLGLHHLFPIPLFILGVALGTIVVELARRGRLRAPFVPALIIEAALLTAFMLLGSACMVEGAIRPSAVWTFYLLAALPALAMGMQNTTLRTVAGLAVHTTYVTGVLQTLAEESARYLLARADGRAAAVHGSAVRASLRAAAAAALLWLAYVGGAVGGGFTKQYWQLYALALPVTVLAVIVVVDLARPAAEA